ncbi:MAG: helix-turn-helix domain-containing protein [Vulcanimicrobiaceae bacterium]
MERIDHVAYFGRAHRTVGAIVQIIVHDDLDDVSQIPLHQLCVRMSELDLRELETESTVSRQREGIMRRITAKRSDESVTRGSGNVFADIGLDQPEGALAKARIVETIADLIARKELSQQEAGKLVSLTQPQISRLMRGDTREFSYERLMRVLTALGQDVEITIRATNAPNKYGRVLVRK